MMCKSIDQDCIIMVLLLMNENVMFLCRPLLICNHNKENAKH